MPAAVHIHPSRILIARRVPLSSAPAFRDENPSQAGEHEDDAHGLDVREVVVFRSFEHRLDELAIVRLTAIGFQH